MKRSWHNLRCCLGICLEGLRKATKNLWIARPSDRYLNPGHPEYEAGVIIAWPRRSMTPYQMHCVEIYRLRYSICALMLLGL
jgi:hypothetical protein